MLIATCLILLANTQSNSILGSGSYSELHVQFASQATAVIGLAGPFTGAKVAGQNSNNPYTLLLVNLKSEKGAPIIVEQLELTGFDPIAPDLEKSSIFELTRDRRHILVKPSRSPDLYVVEIQGNSLKEVSRHPGNRPPGKRQILSVVPDKDSNKIAITSLIYEGENPADKCEIEICELKNNRLNLVKTWQFQSLLQETIYKAHPLGNNLLVLLTRNRIMALNLKTGKIVDEDFVFQNKNKIGWLSFSTKNGWFQHISENSLHVFVNVPGENLIQVNLTVQGDKLQFQEMDTVKTLGKTEEIGLRYADLKSLIFCGQWESDIWKKQIGYKINQRNKIVFESPHPFSTSAAAVLQDQGLILVQEKEALRLIQFQLKDG